AAALGDRDAARGHFDRALTANRHLGAALLVARTLHDAGAALDDGRLRDQARELYAQLGVTQRLGGKTRFDEAALVRAGEVWTVSFAGRTATLRDSKGLRDLVLLLGQPGRPVPAVELATSTGAVRRTSGREDGLHEPGDLGAVIDASARHAYRDRLRQLDRDADDADRDADVAWAAAIAAERDALVAELSTAYGLGGRPRRAGSPVERARTTVTARIRDSIRRIEPVHPEFGRHLRAAIRTGTLCSYEPEAAPTWRLTP
ncbi:MAG: ATPase, partial [Jatrophihabitantaceae bacterium]